MTDPDARISGDKYRQELTDLLNKLANLAQDGRVSKETAVKFIEKSAWWLTHVSGPVREPGYASRLEGNESSWSLNYGSNRFHVSRAIIKCSKELKRFMQRNSKEPNFKENTLRELRQCLSAVVCGCVSGYGGQVYDQYHGDREEMVFGSHAIKTKEFIDCCFEIVPVDRLIARQLQLESIRENQSKFRFSKLMTNEFNQSMSATTRSQQIEHALLTLQSADNILRAQMSIGGKSVFSALTEALWKRQNNIHPLTSLLFSLFSNQGFVKESRSAKPIPKIRSQLRNILELAGFAVPLDDKLWEQQPANDIQKAK